MSAGSGEAPLHGATHVLFGSPTLPYTRITPKWSDPGGREMWLGDVRGWGDALGVQLHHPAPGMLRALYVSGSGSMPLSF